MGSDWIEHKPKPGKVQPAKTHRSSETGCLKRTGGFFLIVALIIIGIACGRPEDAECDTPGDTKVTTHGHTLTCGSDYHWHAS